MSSNSAHSEEAHEHPTWSTYKWIALWLTLITVVEVWAYYIPAFVASNYFVPALLIMSAVKFTVVVMYYMHLKYDHALFRKLFVGPLIIAIATFFALMFVFRKMFQ
ncbi:MAG: cytochrome C oxidase subunit IV family protein [Gemmatimonadaceae bacterium]|nr:cytochrome C oxidase subunit IV family protein [Gemmatimonadaceae bacterium]